MADPGPLRIPLPRLTRRLDNDDPEYLIGDPGLYLCLALAYDSLAAPANRVAADGVSSPDFADMQPRLALRWEHPTSTTWEVILRPGVRSHFGNEFEAEDIAWAFQKNFAYPAMAAWRWRDSAGLESAESVVVLDRHRVRYEVRVNNPNFPAYLQFLTPNVVDAREISQHATTEDPYAIAWLNEHVAGFGAYGLESFSSETASFVAREDYWMGEPDVARVELVRVADRQDGLAMLDTGEPAIALGLDADEASAALRRDDLDVVRTWAGHVRVQLDFRVAPFGDVRVRRALAHATPYEEIIRSGFRGLARPWRSPVKGISPWYSEDFFAYDTDLAVSRRLLDEAGLGDGFSSELYFDRRPDLERVGLILQDAWAPLGVELALHYLDGSQPTELAMVLSTDCGHNLSEPLYDLVHDFASIPTLFPTKSSGDGVGHWHPYLVRQEEIIERLRDALRETDADALHARVDELQRVILDEACTIHVAEVQQTFAARNVPPAFYAPDRRFFHAMQYQNARCDTYLPRW